MTGPRTNADVTLAILAGGQGRRLGRGPKGLVPFRGRPLISYVLGMAPRFGGCLIICNEPETYRAFGVPVFPDVLPRQGAPGGLHSALHHATTEWVLTTACDMPCIADAAIERLLAERTNEVDFVCYEACGQLQPLLGVYRKSMATGLAYALGQGASLRQLLARFPARILPEAVLASVDPALLSVTNINTEDELLTCEQRCVTLSAEGGSPSRRVPSGK